MRGMWGIWHVALDLLFSSVAGGAYWPIAREGGWGGGRWPKMLEFGAICPHPFLYPSTPLTLGGGGALGNRLIPTYIHQTDPLVAPIILNTHMWV